MDDLTIKELRKKEKKERPLRRSFMSAGEAKHIRTELLRITQKRLVEALISPIDGEPILVSLYSHWEKGSRPIPLWAARRMRDLAEAARSYDVKGESDG